MKSCCNIICQLVDSAADSKLKRLKEGESFGIEKPGGESRLYIGQKINEAELDDFLEVKNEGDIVTFKVAVSDLVNYLIQAKGEYLHPENSYRLDISTLYPDLISSILTIEDNFEISFVKNTDNSRYYLSPYPKGKNKYVKIIRPICLPLLTEFNLIKVTSEDSHSTFYFKPTFITQHSGAVSKISEQTIEESSFSSYLAAMRTKPFLLLAGISGTGKSRIVKEMAFASCPPSLRQDEVTPGNYCMIEVKPNWHDSTELLGYVSSIPKPHYVVTPFVNFLLKALHNPKAPFFVCLDEMNLAPVEQYFAEFLSVLESRKLVNGEIVSEPIIKPEIFSKYYDDFKRAYFRDDLGTAGLIPEHFADLWKDLGDNGLRLPSNVVVIGTVNMDDTTYQFSRKVIDRAMTIEMNEVNFDSMFEEKEDTLTYRDNYVHAVHFLPKYTAAKDALDALNDTDKDYLKAEIPNLLNSLDLVLKNTPFRIAYRVENELILYFAALREEKPDAAADALLSTAIDDILMMKVLPRIEGNEDVLTEPLKSLNTFTSDKYPNSNKKISEMQARLNANHFTSFWP